MGFFSFKCAKSNISIPAYDGTPFPMAASHVVLVTPNNERIEGIYDGYGRIGGADVYAKAALYMFGKEDRDLIWNDLKTIMKGRRKIGVIRKYSWEEPLDTLDFEDAIYEPLLGNTMNEIKAQGYDLVTDFERANKLIKIVRFDHYNGESFEELKVSKSCPHQGYFYDRKEALKILKSLKVVK